MSFQAIIMCRRLPPSPQGVLPYQLGNVQFYEDGLDFWQELAPGFIGGPASHVIIARCQGESPDIPLGGLCRALADASHGALLERVPVILNPTYRVYYRGEPVDLEWPDVFPYIDRRHEEETARSAAEQQQKYEDWDQRIDEETDKHVLVDEIIRLGRKTSSIAEHIVETIQEPEWIAQVSLENLRFMIAQRRELLRLGEENEGLYEKWQSHVAKKK